MHIFELHRQILVSRPLEEVFDFFSKAENLEALTPPWVDFEILTPTPIEMKVGALIDYQLRLHGIPLKWRSEISAWDPPHRFVDEQRRGPYRLWIHEHKFEERDGATLVSDDVRYAVLGGKLVQRFFVAPDLKRIFQYRHEHLLRTFGGVEP